jgi:hypothetical protein
MAAISELAARTRETSFGRWWSKAGNMLECIIPIGLVFIIIIGSGAVALGFTH